MLKEKEKEKDLPAVAATQRRRGSPSSRLWRAKKEKENISYLALLKLHLTLNPAA
jgi:hypothetical protein